MGGRRPGVLCRAAQEPARIIQGRLFSALADEFPKLDELHCSAAVDRSDRRHIQLEALNVKRDDISEVAFA
jgi:hypothetical protein